MGKIIPIKFLVLVFGFILIMQSCETKTEKTLIVKNGFVDLSKWDFEQQGSVKLNGEWEFYWNKFLMDTIAFEDTFSCSGLMHVPGLWNNKNIDDFIIPNFGYASYRILLKVPANKDLALKYINSATSCEIFIDGKLEYSAGTPATNIEDYKPSYRPSIINFTSNSNTVELVLQVANFQHKKGGQWEPIIIGEKHQIAQLRNSKVFIEIFLIGAIFIMGLFHLLISAKNRDEKSMFYFGIFALLIAGKFSFSGEFTIYLFANPGWQTIVRLDYLCFYLSVLFFMFFIKSLYPKELNQYVSKVVILTSILFSLSAILLPVGYFSYAMVYFQVFTILYSIYAFYILYIASKKNRDGAIYFFYAFIALFVCMVLDILNENEIIYSISLVPIGLTLFILVQALILSSRIRKALASNKKLSDRLIQQNLDYVKLNEKYKAQNKSLKFAKDKAEESDKFKSAFLANISHEIRTPMNGILGFTGLLNDDNLSKEKRTRYLAILKERGHHLLGVINDIIDVSKIETGQIEIHTEPTSVNELVTDLYNNYNPLAELKKLVLKGNKTLKGYESVVLTDKQKLKQILDNLLSNAIKFTSEGEVEFGYFLKEKFINFYVRDTGIGVSDDEIEIIFDRFNQANKSIALKFGGTGLGLSIVKAYVDKLGGQIWVDSLKGVGSTFMFTIPYNPQLNNLKVKQGASKIELLENDLTILLVEDNMTNAFLLTEMLEQKNIELLVASDGSEAMKLFRENESISLVLLDIKLPDINGYELVPKMKQIRSNVPFIAQTAYALKGDKEKAIEAGFDEYITKPINRKELLRKIVQFTTVV